MGHSIITLAYSGQATFLLNFTLGILSRDHVKLRVNDAVDGTGQPSYTPFDWVNDTEIIAPAGLNTGDKVEITRTVPKDQLVTEFDNGSNSADITRNNLDMQAMQSIMVYHELQDGRIDGNSVSDLINQLDSIYSSLSGEYSGEYTLPLNTLAELAAVTIPPNQDRISVGGIPFERVFSDPGHPFAAQDSAGGWFEIRASEYYSFMAAIAPTSGSITYLDNVNSLIAVAYKQDRPFISYETDDLSFYVDPVGEPLSLDGDEDYIVANTASEFLTPAVAAEYLVYRQQHNRLDHAMHWANSIKNMKEGVVNLRRVEPPQISDPENPGSTYAPYSPIKTFGFTRLEYNSGHGLNVDGVAVTNTIESVSFIHLSGDSRNQTDSDGVPTEDAIWRAVVTYVNPWDRRYAQPGMAVSNRGVSGGDNASKGVSAINGTYEIVEVSPDLRTLQFDVWNARSAIPLPSLPTLGTATANGIVANSAFINAFQIAPVGGWNGKGIEGYWNFERGAKLTISDVTFVDYTDKLNNPLQDAGSEIAGFGKSVGDRKCLYFGFDAVGILRANVGLSGFTGSSIRTYGAGTELYSVHTVIGGLTRNHTAKVGYRFQQNSNYNLIRCTTAGHTQRSVEVGASCKGSMHQCLFANSYYAGYGILDSYMSTNSSVTHYCFVAFYTKGLCELNSTQIYGCQHCLGWSGGVFEGTIIESDNGGLTVAGVGPNVPAAGGYWRDNSSLDISTAAFDGGRITGGVLVFDRDLTLNHSSTGVYEFTFGTPMAAQNFNVVVTPRENFGGRFWFTYLGSTDGFTVHFVDGAGNPVDVDFNFNVQIL